jgi:chaperonin cofactor prefoldin
LESVLAVNDRLETLNALPGIQLPTLSNQIEAANERIQEVRDSIQQLQASVEDFKTGVVETLLVPFLDRIENITNRLTDLEQIVNGFLEQIDQLQVAVQNLQTRIPRTVDIGTIILSLVLIWLVLAQISLILIARFYLRTGRMIWALDSGGQPAEEAVTAPGP